MQRSEDPTKSLTFVVGDVFGNIELLKKMFDKIESYPLADNDTILLLGNYVGGPNARDTLEFIYKHEQTARHSLVTIRGRHDHWFLTGRKSYFSTTKGQLTATSYRNFKSSVPYHKNNMLVSEMNVDRRWLSTFQPFYVTPKIFFTNAGLQANLAIEQQCMGGLLFNPLYQEFLSSSKDFGRIVVHGYHCENETGEVVVKDNRINVFSNPEVTGKLNCLVLNEAASGSGMIEDIFTVETKAESTAAA